MVATFITTYKGMRLHVIERKRERRKNKKKKQITIHKREDIILLNHKMKMHLD